jgi:hypothetical protein
LKIIRHGLYAINAGLQMERTLIKIEHNKMNFKNV